MYAAFVFAIVLSEEGDLVIQHYEHDTRPEHLQSLHTFAVADQAMGFLDQMIRPLMKTRVDPAATQLLLEQVAKGLRDGGGAMDAVIDIENARSVLLGLMDAANGNPPNRDGIVVTSR